MVQSIHGERKFSQLPMKAFAAGLVLLTVAGCRAQEPAKPTPLPVPQLSATVRGVFGTPGTVWNLIENPVQQIRFEKDKITGFGGCNSFFAPVKVGGAFIKFGMIAGTKKLCEPEIMSKEAAFFQRFSEANTFHGNSLRASVLDKTGSAIMKFIQAR